MYVGVNKENGNRIPDREAFGYASEGKLSWKKFLWLFNGLGSDTKIKQVMRIRDMDIPKYNGKNMEQIQEIQKLKSYPCCGWLRHYSRRL